MLSLESDLSDLDSRLTDLESTLADLQEMVGGSTLETTLEDTLGRTEELQATLDAICNEFSLYDGALYDTYLAAC